MVHLTSGRTDAYCIQCWGHPQELADDDEWLTINSNSITKEHSRVLVRTRSFHFYYSLTYFSLVFQSTGLIKHILVLQWSLVSRFLVLRYPVQCYVIFSTLWLKEGLVKVIVQILMIDDQNLTCPWLSWQSFDSHNTEIVKVFGPGGTPESTNVRDFPHQLLECNFNSCLSIGYHEFTRLFSTFSYNTDYKNPGVVLPVSK